MNRIDLKKLIIPNIPYLLFVWLFDKAAQAFRLSPGADLSEKLLALGTGFSAAFKEFSAKKLSQEQNPSIRKALAAFRDKAKQLNANREKVKKKERGIDR